MNLRVIATLAALPVLFAGALPAQSANLQAINEQAQQRLETSIEELAAVRNEISTARTPLIQERDRLQAEANRLRREAQQAARVRNQRQFSLSELEGRVEGLQNTNSYLRSILSDYKARFISQILPSENKLYSETFQAATDAQNDASLSDAERFEALLDVVRLSIERSKSVMGGYSFDGAAILEGQERPGTFIALGPIGYFATSDGSFAGDLLSGTTNVLVDSRANFRDDIASTGSTGSGILPVDSSLGDARRILEVAETPLEHIQKGKIVGWVIVSLFGIALLLFLYKLFQVIGVKKADDRDVQAILNHIREGNRDAALSHAQGVKGPVGEMLVSAVEHSDGDADLLEEALYEKIITTQPKLESLVPMIAVIAATAPLLGLLGTVTGMINTFKLITVFGTGDAASLSTGISEALVTTELGLIVAITSLIGHAILSRMTKGVVTSMEQTAVSFINAIAEMRSGKSKSAA